MDEFVNHCFPRSIFEAMATNEILQIVIFSIFFGVAMAQIGERSQTPDQALDTFAHIILKMVGYVMNFAPLGVFGAIACSCGYLWCGQYRCCIPEIFRRFPAGYFHFMGTDVDGRISHPWVNRLFELDQKDC